jgi:hypothetical protein
MILSLSFEMRKHTIAYLGYNAQEANVMKKLRMVAALSVATLAIMGCQQPTSGGSSEAPKTAITITAIDSVNGSILSGSFTVKTLNSAGAAASYSASTNPFTISVPSDETYDISVNNTGRAQDKHEKVAVGVSAISQTYILQELGNTSYPVVSPSITSIAYTTTADPTSATAVWTGLASGASIDISTITGLKVVATSYASVDDTSWSGYFKVGLDQATTTFSGSSAISKSESTDTSKGLITTTAIFGLGNMTITSGSHTLSIVAYDRTNNRVQRDIAVTATQALTSGADISADKFSGLLADFRLYGVTRSYFGANQGAKALTPISTGSVSYRAALTFQFVDANSIDVPILGFRVYRSTDGGTSYTLAGTVNYGKLSVGTKDDKTTNGTHTYYDADSSLTEGVSYTYKVEAFTDDVHTLTSNPTGAMAFLPAFTSSLASPANKAASVDPATTSFTFTVSNRALWNASISDYYFFAPLIKSKDGTIVYYGQFFYDFAADKLYFYYSSPASAYDITQYCGSSSLADYFSFDAASGTITLKPALFCANTNYGTGATPSYSSGATYEWDIFGYASGTLGDPSYMTASWFQKSAKNAVSKSLADVYQNGQDTLNGWYSFTAQ